MLEMPLTNKARAAMLPSLFLFLIALIASGCQPKPLPQTVVNGSTMGTTYTVKVVLQKGQTLADKDLQTLTQTELELVNQSMSTYIDDSELSVWNHRPDGEWQVLSESLFNVLELSQFISTKSSGAFDVTVMPLVNLWGFGPEERDSPPSDAALNQAMERVGYRQIELDKAAQRARKPAQVYVDLSAIAKGYAVDRIAQALLDADYGNFMVEVGGELVLRGVNRFSKPWRIGIEVPATDVLQTRKAPMAAVDLTDVALATSGDYRNYYEVDGERVSHTISPATGRPITHKLASVSVIADTCAEADAWATALNVLGPREAWRLAEKEGLAAYLVVREGNGFTKRVTKPFEAFLVD